MKITIKKLAFIVILSYMVSLCFSVGSLSSFKMNTHFGMMKKNSQKSNAKTPHEERSKYAPKNLTADDLPDTPLYFKTWIKYFTFNKNFDDKSKKPKYFFKNDAFVTQLKYHDSDSEEDKHEDDEVSFINI